MKPIQVSHGFILPILVLLMVSGAIALAAYKVVEGVRTEAKEVGEELLFWQRGLANYSALQGAMPINLTFLMHLYQLDLARLSSGVFFSGLSLDGKQFSIQVNGVALATQSQLLQQYAPQMSADGLGNLIIPVQTLPLWQFGAPLLARESKVTQTFESAISMAGFDLLEVDYLQGNLAVEALDSSALSQLNHGVSETVIVERLEMQMAMVGEVDIGQLLREIEQLEQALGGCLAIPQAC